MYNNYIIQYLLKCFHREFSSCRRHGVYSYTQKMMAYNSNKIEGSTLTIKQTTYLFETRSLDSQSYTSKSVQEMTGHFIMFNHMFNTYQQPLTEQLIKDFHYDLKANVFEDKANGFAIGDWKTRTNAVGDIIVSKPQEVPRRIHELIRE